MNQNFRKLFGETQEGAGGGGGWERKSRASVVSFSRITALLPLESFVRYRKCLDVSLYRRSFSFGMSPKMKALIKGAVELNGRSANIPNE